MKVEMFATPGHPFRARFPSNGHCGCYIAKGDLICYVGKGVVSHYDCAHRPYPAYDPVLGPEDTPLVWQA